MGTVISVEHLSKAYRLGQIGTGTFARDLEVWWAKLRGKPNPLLKIGQEDHGNRDGEIIWALKDVSFTVEQGEVLGIIGRNGAGKSTLLKILSRITAPTEGRVKVKGRIASLLEVGTGFHPELTGRENIYLNGAILGMSRREIDRKFDEIVAFAEIEPFIDTPVKRYSSGMYVRLAFAVAAHLDAEILLVDEVLAVGDAEFQKKCLGKMGEVSSQEGRTVLFVSHNMAAVVNLCPTSIFLENGTIKLREQSSKVIEEYLRVPSVEKIDLNEYRPKWALPYITSVKLVNARGENTDTVPMGSDLIIKVKYSCPREDIYRNRFWGSLSIMLQEERWVDSIQGGLNYAELIVRTILLPLLV
ncbi:ABC transporter ATP-binding protein [uncultured Anaerolinea sp.]|uniref:ABC transporter ATP-binding protein n=1 Tax=uncultured Anaerolinea sp. TaxID=430695 RepID=UPI002635491C|nr:ABC transporter ATP-binding protein [uncultured Anaerolinea sp.]